MTAPRPDASRQAPRGGQESSGAALRFPVRSSEPLLRRLLAEASQAPVLFFPKLEPHPAALVVGLGGLVLGVATVREGHGVLLGWLALGLCVAGMLMYATLLRPGIGWQLDLAARRLLPVGLQADAADLPGAGWRVYCVGGSGRRSLALEFRHVDGGKPLRFFHTRNGAGRTEHQLTSQLADALAARLGMQREGLSL